MIFFLPKRSPNVGIPPISNDENLGFWKDASQLLIVFYIIYISLLQLVSHYVAMADYIFSMDGMTITAASQVSAFQHCDHSSPATTFYFHF